MASARMHNHNSFILTPVRIPFDEWLVKFVDWTIEKGHRSCPECSADSKCQDVKVEKETDSLIATWKCENNHLFTEKANRGWFKQKYEKTKPYRCVAESMPNIQAVRTYMASKL